MAEKKIFVNKKSILEYLGKNPNDRNLIERMIARKEIVKVDGGYELVQKEDVRELRKRIEELEDKITMMEFDLDVARDKSNSSDVEELKKDLKEANAQWLYWEDKAKKYTKAMNLVLQITYNTIKPKLGKNLEDYGDFRDNILSSVRDQLGDFEE